MDATDTNCSNSVIHFRRQFIPSCHILQGLKIRQL